MSRTVALVGENVPMAEATSFEVVVHGLKAASTIAKELLSLDISREVSAKAVEMNAAILEAQHSAIAAQTRQMELADRVRQLEEDVVQLKDWDVQKKDYELKNLDGTSFAYVLKDDVETSEPPHWLCQPCFEDKKKAVLQRTEKNREGRATWGCPICKADIRVLVRVRPKSPPGTVPGL